MYGAIVLFLITAFLGLQTPAARAQGEPLWQTPASGSWRACLGVQGGSCRFSSEVRPAPSVGKLAGSAPLGGAGEFSDEVAHTSSIDRTDDAENTSPVR